MQVSVIPLEFDPIMKDLRRIWAKQAARNSLIPWELASVYFVNYRNRRATDNACVTHETQMEEIHLDSVE